MTINGFKLDEYQMAVINSPYKNTLVVAGAGAGKSLTIIGKIKYLLSKKMNEEEILVISLTNDAVNNLYKSLLENDINNVKVYTFHKLALSILKSHNYNYEIAPDDLLDEIIDKVLNSNNKYVKKARKKLITNSKEKNSVKKLIATFINLFKANNYKIDYFKDILKQIKKPSNIFCYFNNKYLLLIIINVYLEYERVLKEENLIDFNDMINKCSDVVNKNGVINNWKYIIIDEYQDTSLSKFMLLKSILDKTNASFLGVGDDFQSIYRFTGCDLNIFLNFNNYLNDSGILKLVYTYRNFQELINVAGSFIMKNKYQIKKELLSNKTNSKPIKIYRSNNKIKALKHLLGLINEKDIMVIGRNNKDINAYIDNTFKQKENRYIYQDKIFRYLTAHKSKGLQAEAVILINLENDILGFPSKVPSEKILKYVNNIKDIYPNEEERRLFYVALTRTKNNVYLIESNNPSIFLKEIKKYNRYIEYLK